MNPAAKVLAVDDDPFFLRVLQKRIAREGYTVATAADGREGMKAIVTFEPDLVISDWMMPEVDGLELCQSIKTGLGEAAPYFILLTARGEISDRLLGLQTGADDFLTKPCDDGELLARVRAGIRIISLTQQLRRAVADLRVVVAELELSRAPGRIMVCSGCRRVRVPGGAWQDLAQILAAPGPIGPARCPKCEGSGLGGANPTAAAA